VFVRKSLAWQLNCKNQIQQASVGLAITTIFYHYLPGTESLAVSRRIWTNLFGFSF